MENFKCQACGKKEYDPNCNWNQGRCPWHPALFSIMPEAGMQYVDLKQMFKDAWQWFKSAVKRVLRV